MTDNETNNRQEEKRRRPPKPGQKFIRIGLLLIAAALLLTGYNLWDEARARKASNEALEELIPRMQVQSQTQDQNQNEEEIPELTYPDYILNPEMEMPIQTIEGSDYVAILQIPALNLELPIISEWSYPKLKIAPCRYQGTAYRDDLIIMGHNYSGYFRKLDTLEPGDKVSLTDMGGNTFNYEATEIEILSATAVERMTSGEWDMTLFTCTIGGQARVAVRCLKVE